MIEVSDDTRRRFTVAALIGDCEAIAASGVLTEPAELSLRLMIAETLAAHGMPARAEFPRAKDAA